MTKKTGTKDLVLRELMGAKDGYISGEELAGRLFVTRASVWKAVNALRQEGYPVAAVTNRGYRLEQEETALDEEKLQELLTRQGICCRAFCYEETDSTNDQALRLSREEREDILVVAASQRGGRGRRGRSFFSPPGTGLYMSYVFSCEGALDRITAAAGCAMTRAIDEVVFAGKDKMQLKWVNDIFLHDKKAGGILSEAHVSMEEGEGMRVVIGIGVNLRTPEGGFPGQLKKTACALSEDGDAFPEGYDPAVREELAAAFVRYMKGYMEKPEEIMEEYRSRCFVLGRYILVLKGAAEKPEKHYAKALSIDDSCRLLVEYENGQRELLSSGEISTVKY